MFGSLTVVLFIATAFNGYVTGHGIVSGIVADGVYYQGYNPSFQYEVTRPTVVGWSSPLDISHGFINPNNYTTPDIICHLSANPAATYAIVAAGGNVQLQWTPWPSTHHGPVIDYLANCNGDCTTVDKTTLLFNKIDGVGLIDDSVAPGKWASDQLIAANNSWTVTIPSRIAPGNYVLRHEIVALHSAENPDGAQNYPQCVNLMVYGSGTDSLTSGTLGKQLYTPIDPGILVNIYTSLSSYEVPGPALLSTTTPVPPSSNVAASSGFATTVVVTAVTLVSHTVTVSIPATSTTNFLPTRYFTTLPSTVSSEVAEIVGVPTSVSFTSSFPARPTGDDTCEFLYSALAPPSPDGGSSQGLHEWLEVISSAVFRPGESVSSLCSSHHARDLVACLESVY